MSDYIIYSSYTARAGFGYVYAQKKWQKGPGGRSGKSLVWGSRKDRAMRFSFVEAMKAIAECPDIAGFPVQSREEIEVQLLD